MTALTGTRVLDLSRVLAGPSCGQLFADMGADVIKIEDREGDENRRWLPVVDGRGANFWSVNRGKRGMTLNLKSPRGQEILKRLVERADVLIENFPPSTAERLGLSWPQLSAINPDLVHVSITGYGSRGPYANRPGYDNMLQAFSGMMAMTGEGDRGPARLGPSVIDMGTGMLAFAGACAALLARAQGKARGQHVEASLMQTALAQLGYHFTARTMAGVVPSAPVRRSGMWCPTRPSAPPMAGCWWVPPTTPPGCAWPPCWACRNWPPTNAMQLRRDARSAARRSSPR
jgi:crotonobetainyl-CoA:carnitine CoA-transferase CaiB-like acyl-CoA transferase